MCVGVVKCVWSLFRIRSHTVRDTGDSWFCPVSDKQQYCTVLSMSLLSKLLGNQKHRRELLVIQSTEQAFILQLPTASSTADIHSWKCRNAMERWWSTREVWLYVTGWGMKLFLIQKHAFGYTRMLRKRWWCSEDIDPKTSKKEQKTEIKGLGERKFFHDISLS